MNAQVENGCPPLYHLPAHTFTQRFASDFTVPLPVALGMVMSHWSCPSITQRQLYSPHSCLRVSSPELPPGEVALTVCVCTVLHRLV